MYKMDLPTAQNGREVRYLIGDTAKNVIACDHWARGEANRFKVERKNPRQFKKPRQTVIRS
jgi:hypothetical protein